MTDSRGSFDRLRDDIEAIRSGRNKSDLYRLRDFLFGEYTRLKMDMMYLQKRKVEEDDVQGV